MGMAASQVRFLSLQHRKNSIGRQLSTLSNRKMSLSRDMNEISRNYTNALNQISLKWSNDCGNTYHALSYDMLMKPNDVNTETPYILTNAKNGKVILNDSALLDKDGNKIMTGNWTIGQDFIPAGELSYLKIAKLISAFTNVSDDGNELLCVDGQYAKDENGNWVGKANPGGYYIPSNDDFSFDNNLRMKIFMLMGLVTKDQIDTQNSMLTELYGSQEAKETGVYPVGSAWGDYYIALANLEAYDAYVNTDQSLSSANTFNNSKKTQQDFVSTLADYTYKTNVEGNSATGTSTCIQTSSTGAVAHVDYTSGVIKNNTTGNYEKINWNEDSTEMQDLFDDEKYNYTITDGSSTYSYGLNDSAGLFASYKHDDLLADALIGLKAANNGTLGDATVNPRTATEFDIAQLLENGGGIVEVATVVNEHKYTASRCQDAMNAALDNLMNGFTSILKNTTLMDLTTEMALTAFENAKSATKTLIKASATGDCWSVWESASKDKDDCKRKAKAQAASTGIGYQSKRFSTPKIGSSWDFRAYTSMYIDTAKIFNTFLTFFNKYYSDPSAQIGLTEQSTGLPTISADSSEEVPTPTVSLATYGGNKYLQTKMPAEQNGSIGGVASSLNVISMTRTSMQTTNNGLGGQAYTHTDGTVYYENFNTVDELSYFSAGGSFAGVPVKIKETDAAETTVYAVLSRTEKQADGSYLQKYFYFTNTTDLNNYINNNVVNASVRVETVNSAVNTSSYPLTLQDDVNDTIKLLNNSNGSFYDIRITGKVNDSATYRNHLVEAVNKAQEKIEKLEADIEDFYSSSDKKIMDYYDAIFLRIAEQGWEQDEHTANATYLNNKIQNNDIFLTECLQKNSSTGFRYTAKQATNISKIFSVHDTNAEHEALVKYESEKNMLQYKENAIDTRMRLLETEQEAINTEMESVQKVCNDNISKYFKIFA